MRSLRLRKPALQLHNCIAGAIPQTDQLAAHKCSRGAANAVAAANTEPASVAPVQRLTPQRLHCWYADHQEVILPDGHRFPMDKYRATRLRLQAEAHMTQLAEFHPSPPASVEDLQKAHTLDYINRFISGRLNDKDMRAIGFPWTPTLVSRNLASVGGTVAATRALLQQPELRMTAHISGGTHHAFAHTGEGFCVFNDIAVAAEVAMRDHGVARVLVIDLDVHQGNGTAEIFAADDRVTTFDMFCDSNYPWRTRRTNTYDVPLQPAVTDAQYLELLGSWLLRLREHDPQLVFFQAGVDPLDADSLGKLNLSRHALNARNNAVYSFALELDVPLVITMGGGYAKPDVEPTVAAHADVYRTAAYRLGAAFGAQSQARGGSDAC